MSLQEHLKQSLKAQIRATLQLKDDRLTVAQTARLIGLNQASLYSAISYDWSPIQSFKEDGKRFFLLDDVVDHLATKAIPACLSQGGSL
ncbi:MAG: hypothetical protein PHP57_06345 [Sideroxydans sp.]|nr:hypothetical protein [Sideroxydans sp.]